MFYPASGDGLMCTNKTCFAGVVPWPSRIFLTQKSFSVVSMRKIFFQKFLSADQTSISGVNQMFSPSQFLNGIWFLCCNRKFLDRFKLKRLSVAKNSTSHVYQENVEHIRSTAFRWRCDEVEMRWTCLEVPSQKSIQSKVTSCIQLSQIVLHDTVRGHHHKVAYTEIFRHSKEWFFCTVTRDIAKKCGTRYPLNSRPHHLWFPTSDRLKTWLIPPRTIRSKQCYESTMVWRNLPFYRLSQCLLPLCRFFFLPPHSYRANYIRNAYKWCTVIGKPGCARLEGTPTMDLELKDIRKHM